YSLKLPAGTYRPVPVKAGFVFNLAAAATFTVNAGANTAAGDSALVAGTRTISGQVRDDAVSPVTLGGMFVYGAGNTGTFSLTFSNDIGNYVLNAGAADTSVGTLESQSAAAGVLA